MLDFSLSYDIASSLNQNRIKRPLSDNIRMASYIIYPKELYQHMLAFGYSGQDLFNYSKIRQAFSLEDVAKLICYNNYLSYSNIIFNLLSTHATDKISADKPGELTASEFSYTLEKLEPILGTLSTQDKNELFEFVLPMAKSLFGQIRQKLSNESKTLEERAKTEPDLLDRPCWKKITINPSGYYVIIVENDFLLSLKVRSKCQAFVSECLQTEIAHIGLDLTQQTYLYGLYLDLLQKQSKGIQLL